MERIAHYVSSTHWDREWYESFQGYRMRLVSLLDEVLLTLQTDPDFKSFVTDGQVIPLADFLEIRPGREGIVLELVKAGRLKLGPWYVLPDEWLVSGESLIRNLQIGIRTSSEYGAPPSRAGFLCDMFGHTGQMPQIMAQLGISGAFVWRGTTEKDHSGHFSWEAPDGTRLPTYRFGYDGYCTYGFAVRKLNLPGAFDRAAAVDCLLEYVLAESLRSPLSPILLFDGADHMEIEPQTSALLAQANLRLVEHGIRIVHSDLDSYMADVLKEREKIARVVHGELRFAAKENPTVDNQWLIPGVLSSRIKLKQRNAECEDELCLWAEPMAAFASDLGHEYPLQYLNVAWKHLLENHAHDSICGCSIDQVHQDMIYRFDQSLGISTRLATSAMKTIARAVVPAPTPEGTLAIVVFNNTTSEINEPVDLEIPLPTNWSSRFQEFFGYEEKFAFRLRYPGGEEIRYQLVGQRRDSAGFQRERYHFPVAETRHIISVTAHLRVPAMGYLTLLVEPSSVPTRYLGSMAVSHRSIENELLRVQVHTNGTITLTDKRSGQVFSELLTYEDRADIGDGWYHGLAVNDQIFTSTASAADVSLIADGCCKATLRIALTLQVPDQFDFKTMTRSGNLKPMRITSEVTLRAGTDRVEVKTVVDNQTMDHRLRVLLPTNLHGGIYLSDAAFDVVERAVALSANAGHGRELEVETRPQQTWTAFGDGKSGLATVSRGLPESTVCDREDRPIALTLLRSFRRAIFSNDNIGGQSQSVHTFRHLLVPFTGTAPLIKLFNLGQRVNGGIRAVEVSSLDNAPNPKLLYKDSSGSFLNVVGEVVVTAVQRDGTDLLVRLFNPTTKPQVASLKTTVKFQTVTSVSLEGKNDPGIRLVASHNGVELHVPAKRITTLRFV